MEFQFTRKTLINANVFTNPWSVYKFSKPSCLFRLQLHDTPSKQKIKRQKQKTKGIYFGSIVPLLRLITGKSRDTLQRGS